MRKILSILLLTTFALSAGEVPDPNYFVFHIGYYNGLKTIPMVIAMQAIEGNGYSFVTNGATVKKVLAVSCAAIGSVMIIKYLWSKMNFKRRKRYCFTCFKDLTNWDLIDPKKIVEPTDCYVCSLPDIEGQ